MSFLSELEHIKKETFGIAVMVTILLIIPGFTVIFYFFRELFISSSALKLILLSTSIITPLLLPNFAMLLSVVKDIDEKDEEYMYMSFTSSVIVSAVLIYIVLFFSYLFKLSFQSAFLVVLVIQVVVILRFVYKERKRNKTK